MAAPAATKTALTLAQADEWFNNTIIPKRTASAGLSFNRIWKTPTRKFTGNTEDPDGLCGDTSLYVYEEFYTKTGGYTTTDGFHIGLVLWEGLALNHMANVMMVRTKIDVQTYTWDGMKQKLVSVSGPGKYDKAELFTLHVYDLYYKKARSLKMWWQDCDCCMGGTITLGFPYNIDD